MSRRLITALLAVLLAGFAAGAAAHGGYRHHGYGYGHGHGRSHFDFYLGPVWWGPRWDPYYDEPRTIIIEREAPVYIQRAPAAASAPQAQAAPAAPPVWYYCPDPAGYYPYVPKCNQPWVSVDPRTVAPPPAQ